MKIIKVRFLRNNGEHSDKEYAYRSWRDDIEAGHYVVVDSPVMSFVVAYVTEVYSDLTDASKATKWVVDIIDTTEYNRIMGAEQRRKDLLSELSRREKVLSEADRYRRLAAIDPEAAKLVEELDRLNMQYAPAIEHVPTRGVERPGRYSGAAAEDISALDDGESI